MFVPAAAIAEPTYSTAPWVLAFLIYVGPLVVLGAALVLCIGAYRRDLARRTRYLARAESHLDRMEAKTDRMIKVLESIDRSLGDRTSTEPATPRPPT